MKSLVKDIMDSNGKTVDQVVEGLVKVLGWDPKSTKSWFENKALNPVVTQRKGKKPNLLYTKITKAQWKAIFDVIGGTPTELGMNEAMIKSIQSHLTAKKADAGVLSADEVTEIYNQAYENRGEIYQNYLTDKRKKEEAAAKKVVSKKTVAATEAATIINQIDDMIKKNGEAK